MSMTEGCTGLTLQAATGRVKQRRKPLGPYPGPRGFAPWGGAEFAHAPGRVEPGEGIRAGRHESIIGWCHRSGQATDSANQ
ncbi:hypothetical protein AG1IA_02161 [Rhizoctonia solani AG-1 IA]|uniref:Uncharacterized protein n=1 Tax=Thanatephorus cucumeris (strain AG1-IA) TaxID=983506 RepID=L8X5C1_THACA|nr:hypothetical protein AG1IA_02161 [Rhizoctonia solani AG-1 IA]